MAVHISKLDEIKHCPTGGDTHIYIGSTLKVSDRWRYDNSYDFERNFVFAGLRKHYALHSYLDDFKTVGSLKKIMHLYCAFIQTCNNNAHNMRYY